MQGSLFQAYCDCGLIDIRRLPHCGRDTSLIIISTHIQCSTFVINTWLNQNICSVIEDLKNGFKISFPKKERKALILATSPVSPSKGRASETTSLKLETFASLGSRYNLFLIGKSPSMKAIFLLGMGFISVSRCKLALSCCQHDLKRLSSCCQHVLKLLSKCNKALNKL